ncbi:MAG: DUF3375 family protein [Aggregatilineales bacterium]
MNHYQLEQHDLRSPGIQLLRSQNAPLILSFLYQQFHAERYLTRSYTQLRDALTHTLDDLNDNQPRYPLSAEQYLRQWADPDHDWIRIFSDVDGEYHVEPTSHTQLALGWMASLQLQAPLSTQSRFQLILDNVDAMIVGSTTDVDTRLAQLEAERDRITAEIDAIHESGRVQPRSDHDLRGQFELTEENARQLLQDFSAVQEEFTKTARIVQRAQIQPGLRKGAVLNDVLAAETALRESDVGKSFYAFWHYLQLPGNQERLRNQLVQLYQIEALSAAATPDTVLRGLVNHLLSAGLRVDQSNRQLSEQLRRLLDEAYRTESRRIRELSNEIKQLIIQLDDDKLPDDLLVLEKTLNINLLMERQLYSPPEHIKYDALPTDAIPDNPDGLDNAVSYFRVDARRLREYIDLALEEADSVTLTHLLESYPLEQGLSELIAYLDIAVNDPRHTINPDRIVTVLTPAASADDNYSLTLETPQITFNRTRRQSL